MNTPKSVLLYRFLPADSAIKTIEAHAFRVSRLLELNDPFEWMPGLDPVQPHAEDLARWCMGNFIAEMNEVFGILAFSESFRDSVLWSHYADSHRGIVFEVDHFIGPDLHPVQYTDTRPVLDPRWIHDKSKEAELSKLLSIFWRQKSTGWAYEKERRSIIELKECKTSNGMYFKPIPPNFVKRVILGVRCSISAAYIRRALDLHGLPGVQITQATHDNKTYEIKC
jgi:hypothetical protein